MKSVTQYISDASEWSKGWAMLILRFVLAFGFYHPAVNKFKDINGAVEDFLSYGIPLPKLTVLLVGSIEFLGFFLLLLGFATRYVTMPLMMIMIAAIFVVHWGNGFAAVDDGFQVPLYFLVMLLVLFSKGPGRYSIDEAVVEKMKE